MVAVGLTLAPVMVSAQMAPGGRMEPGMRGGTGSMPGGMGMGGMMQMPGMTQQMQGMMQQMADMLNWPLPQPRANGSRAQEVETTLMLIMDEAAP